MLVAAGLGDPASPQRQWGERIRRTTVSGAGGANLRRHPIAQPRGAAPGPVRLGPVRGHPAISQPFPSAAVLRGCPSILRLPRCWCCLPERLSACGLTGLLARCCWPCVQKSSCVVGGLLGRTVCMCCRELLFFAAMAGNRCPVELLWGARAAAAPRRSELAAQRQEGKPRSCRRRGMVALVMGCAWLRQPGEPACAPEQSRCRPETRQLTTTKSS